MARTAASASTNTGSTALRLCDVRLMWRLTLRLRLHVIDVVGAWAVQPGAMGTSRRIS